MNKDITLPYELATKDLSLQEIGTIFTMFATQKMTQEEITRWANDDEYLEIVEDLLMRDFVKVSHDDNTNISVVIDLTDKEPKPFWELCDYDDKDNPIYQHPSNWGEEEGCGPFLYKIKPILRDLKLVWEDCSDADLSVDNEQFDSLEEAEEFYQTRLNDELFEIHITQ